VPPPGDRGGHRYCRPGNLPLCRNPFQLLKLNLQVPAGAKLGLACERLHGTALGRPADSKTWISTCGCARLSRWIGMFEQLQCTAGPVGWRQPGLDHRRAIAPVGQACRGRWSLRPLRSWTSETDFLLHQSGAPHHPLSKQGYSTVGDLAFQRPGCWQRSRRRRASAKMPKTRAAGLQGFSRNVAAHLAWRDGEGTSEMGVPGLAHRLAGCVIGNSRWHWAGRQQAPPPACAVWHSQAPASLKPKEGASGLRCWACVGQPHPSSSVPPRGAASPGPACRWSRLPPGSALTGPWLDGRPGAGS